MAHAEQAAPTRAEQEAGHGATGPGGPLRRLLSSTVVYALTGVAQQTAGFLLIPVYTRVIPPAEYGLLELLSAFLPIAVLCVTLGLSSAINKVYHRDCRTPEERQAVLGTALAGSLPLIMLVGGLLLALAAPVSRALMGSAEHADLFRIAVASSLCYAVLGMVLGGLRARERTFAYSAVTVTQFSLAVATNLVLVLAVRLGVKGVLLGNLVANVSALGLALVLTGAGGRVAFDRRLLRPLFAFGVAIIPAMLASWVMDVSDRYLLRLFRDLAEVAQYGVGYKFGMAVQLLVTWPFQLAWPAIAFGISREEGHERTYARVLTYLLLLLTLVVLVFVAASTSVLPTVIGRKYAPACGVVPVIAAAYALSALVYCVSPGIHVAGRTRALSLIGVGAAASNLALGLLLIPSLGMTGAAWATVAAYGLALAGTVWLAQRSHPVRYEGGRLVRILAAGGVAYGAMRLLSAHAAGAWLAVGQVGALAVFLLLLLLSGFMGREEREYVAGLVHRYALVEGRQPGA
jgi:O-antigen/teichoic acid export membrane protein